VPPPIQPAPEQGYIAACKAATVQNMLKYGGKNRYTHSTECLTLHRCAMVGRPCDWRNRPPSLHCSGRTDRFIAFTSMMNARHLRSQAGTSDALGRELTPLPVHPSHSRSQEARPVRRSTSRRCKRTCVAVSGAGTNGTAITPPWVVPDARWET